MRPGLRRFVAVGAGVTAVDLGLLAALDAKGWPPAAADGVAIAGAAAVSYPLHRTITFRGDPYVRWVDMPSAYVAVAALSGAIDVGVTTLLARRRRAKRRAGPVGLLPAKVPALVTAAVVRALAYRTVLATEVQRDLAERAPRAPADGALRLSVVVPAYAEVDRIAGTVKQLRAELADVADAGGLEIVVSDDGSPDGTADAARAAGADQVLEARTNRGKGAAVRAGVLAARGRTVAFTDADLAYSPGQLRRLLAEVETGWDVAVGSRKHTDTTTLVRAGRLRELGGRVINLLTYAVLLGRHRDTQCGLKAFRGDVARFLFGQARIDGFAFDVELFHLAERHRLSLTEVPVAVANSERSTVRIGPDALRLALDLVRIRRGPAKGWYDTTPGPAIAPH